MVGIAYARGPQLSFRISTFFIAALPLPTHPDFNVIWVLGKTANSGFECSYYIEIRRADGGSPDFNVFLSFSSQEIASPDFNVSIERRVPGHEIPRC
jgi:hypothetical protein